MKKGYYDIDDMGMDCVAVELVKNGMLDDVFYLKDLQQRKLFITEGITQNAVNDAVRHIMQFNREDENAGIPDEERKPIILYLASYGGEDDAGYTLIDAIITSKTPVYTVNQGYWYSMGFLIGLAGHKRFAMPSAKFLMHDGSQLIYNSGAKAQDQMAFNRQKEERIKEYVLSRTKISSDLYDAQMRKEWYMFVDEAKELGVIDYVVGKDCQITDIV